MKPFFEITTDASMRVVSVRMTGVFDEDNMRAWTAAYRTKGTDLLTGRKHMVVADMRGMKPVHPEIAALMGEEIGYARRHGVVLCAHVSDSVVQRLQAARVARQNSPEDDVTVEVESPEEARRVIEAYAKFLDDPRFSGSIREALSSAPPSK
jgi:hypothetical protein